MSVSTVSKWILPTVQLEAENRLVDELQIPQIVARILVNRGYCNPELADKFLNPKLTDLHDPMRLPDIHEAVRHLLHAKENDELIYLHGDYDVDGVTSAAIFDKFLRKIGCRIITHVPHRMKEGYGIHADAVEDAHAKGAKLFLTCDCGGSAFDQIERALELGMRVVVTDHHHVGERLPKAHAFVNPHRPDSTYPFPYLCGAGVVFKVCQAITQEIGWPVEKFQRAFIDLTAVATIADIMPLVDENRILVRNGLPEIENSKNHGIRALLRVSGLLQKVKSGLTSTNVSFQISPRLNAAGRMDDAKLSLQLLLSDDLEEALAIALKIEALNTERKTQQDAIVEEALQRIETDKLHELPIIIVEGKGWHQGIIGIVAGKIKERFNRPTFVLTYDERSDSYHGSGRSIPGFNLAKVISANGDIVSGGGHEKAAGLSICGSNLDIAKARLVDYARQVLDPDLMIARTTIDSEARMDELTLETARMLRSLEPFGEANPCPRILVRDLHLAGFKPTKNPEHVFPLFRSDGPDIMFKCWSMSRRFADHAPGESWNVACELMVDDFNGERASYQLVDYEVV